MNPPPPNRRRAVLWLLVLTVLALLASLALNVELLREVRHSYAQQLDVRMQPIAESAVTRSGNPSGTRVLFLGDSRAADWSALPADRFYTLNAGVPGEATAQIRWRTEAILLAEMPSVVVVQAGINDLKAIGVEPKRADIIKAQCITNLAEIVRLCRRHDARVILTLVLPPGHMPLVRRVVWSEQIGVAVQEVNQQISLQYTNTEGVAVLDLDKILAATGARPGEFPDYRDALHLKPEAYAKFEPELIRLIGQPAPPKQLAK